MIGPFRESSNLTTKYLRLTVQNKNLINVRETTVFEVDKSNKEILTFLIEFYPGMTTATLKPDDVNECGKLDWIQISGGWQINKSRNLILFIRNVQFSALSSSVVDSTRVTAMMVKVFRFFRSKHRVFSLFVQLKSKLCE